MFAEALTRSLAATTAYLMEGEVRRHKNRREIIVQVNEELADNGYPEVHVDNVSGRQDTTTIIETNKILIRTNETN